MSIHTSSRKLGLAFLFIGSLSISAYSTTVHNWNITSTPQQSRNDNRTQLTIAIQNSLGEFLAFSKPPVVESEPAANRSCVPMASYSVYSSAVDSWISSLDAKGILSKSILTTTNVLTSMGYLGCMLGNTTTETAVSTVTLTPKIIRSRPPCVTDADGCGKCNIIAETVQLFYWPVSTSAANSKPAFLASTSGNVSAIYNGITFTSPSVYLSYQNVWTSKDFCKNTGRNYSGALLTLHPRSLTSVASFYATRIKGVQVSVCRWGRVNYADLNKPASTSASMTEWPSNQSGTANNCQIPDQKPILLVPPEVRNLDPDWKDCDIWFWGAHDPPHALTPADALSGPISTVHPTVSSSAAVSSPAPPPPVATSRSRQAPATTIESTSADITRVFKPSTTDPPSSVSKSEDPSVIDPASPQPAPKVVPILDSEVVTRTKGGQSTSADTLSYIGPIMTSSNQVISINTKGILVGGTTVTDARLPAFESATRIVTPLIFESMIFSARPSDYVVSGQTLRSGSRITISGTTIQLAPSVTALIVGTYTTALATAAALPTLTIGSQTFSPNPTNAYSMGGQFLTAGGVITISGTPISLAPSATALIVDSITTPLASATTSPALTIGSQTFSADSSGGYQIMGQHLTPGGAIIVSGTPISLASSPTALVIESSTEILGPGSTAPGLGALIMSAIANEGSMATTSNNTMGGNASHSDVPFTGGSERKCRVSWLAPISMSLCSAIYIVGIVN